MRDGQGRAAGRPTLYDQLVGTGGGTLGVGHPESGRPAGSPCH